MLVASQHFGSVGKAAAYKAGIAQPTWAAWNLSCSASYLLYATDLEKAVGNVSGA